jgi:5-histidylcysteine sulfoxide synthase/putative 4-mercaptohistidine N1-methyltranferase
MTAVRIPPLVLDGRDPVAKRQEIREIFQRTFSLYERLFEHLATPDAWYRKAIPLRHPLIFYFGHTGVFYVNKLLLAGLVSERIDPLLESLFAVGVDEMSWDDLDERHYDWPEVARVAAYRERVRTRVDDLIARLPLELPIDWDSPWWAILMGIEHENIHLETSSVLMRQLPLDLVRPVADFPALAEGGPAPRNHLESVPAGTIRLGKARDHRLYGWDNEYGREETRLAGFAAARQLVSNGEFLPFVEGGGYAEMRYWTEEARDWLGFARPAHPSFWVRHPEGWRLRLIAEERPMPWNWPVEVNCHEARAFCRWLSEREGRTLRLPLEAEWHRMREESGLPDCDSWKDAPGNIGLAHGASPAAVDRFPQGRFCDVVGNVWQWTETPIYPFPGFTPHPLYDDFSVPTFDGRHHLLLGGSFMSLGNETQASARYAFRRHFFQHAGFRYVESKNPLPAIPVYETDQALTQYAEFHYGPQYFGVPNFLQAVAREALAASSGRPLRRALDVGCSVGRTAFELARACPEVTGIDLSARFIQVGVKLRDEGRYAYAVTEEGEIESFRTADLASLGLAETAGRVRFFQDDATNLKPLYTDYDLVVAANLIDRLREPRKFLATIGGRIHSGGLLLITSPYTWLVEHTPREEWLGGFRTDGENRTTLEALREILAPRFRLLEGYPRDLPFVIRETARKYQHSIAQLTLWERTPAV